MLPVTMALFGRDGRVDPDTRWGEMKQNRLFFLAVQFLEQPFGAAMICGLACLFELCRVNSGQQWLHSASHFLLLPLKFPGTLHVHPGENKATAGKYGSL